MVNREDHNEHFTLVDNAVLQNVNLSWEARGFFAYLLSLPDDWSFSLRGLVKMTGASETVIRRLLDELKTYGYITMTRHTNEQGKFTSCTWDIYEKPSAKNHLSKKPQVDKTTCGENHVWSKPREVPTTCGENDTIQSTKYNKVLNIQSTKETKKEKEIKKKESLLDEVEKMFLEFWTAYPKKVDKKGSFRAFKNIPKLKEVFPGIMRALEVQKGSRQWTSDNGQYIPNPTTYIHQERWLTVTEKDELQTQIDQIVRDNIDGFLV
ncbi:MAG: hypothetical protein IIY21_25095 [Clostridiales bacterium]|nr:hypothetical protein [Clostridiales bacterium]MBQ1575044.1 hypothetical protein [Clostridiales bacterium]